MRMPRIIRWPKSETAVWLPVPWRDELATQSNEHAPDETGGILVGYQAKGGDLVVTHVVEGGPKAERSASRFKPDGEWQASEVAKTYETSGRRETYLGDWHSHPRSLPKPSASDQRTARRIAEYEEARAPHPLMIIVGSETDGWRLAAYRFDGKRLRKARLNLCR
jgi:integrative and conjugative element protein (TIGR02256 family)